MTRTEAAIAEFNRVYQLPPSTPGRVRMLCEALAEIERADAAHWRAGGDVEKAEEHEAEARSWDVRARQYDVRRAGLHTARGEEPAAVRP